MDFLFQLLIDSALNMYAALRFLVMPALAILVLAILFRRDHWMSDMRQVARESELSLKIILFNAAVSMPLISIVVTALYDWIHSNGLMLFSVATWESLPVPLVLFFALFFGDFVGYWRHRLEHTPLLWPAHAVHHSDTEVTWLTSARWHPINLLTVHSLAGSAMLIMGFPVWAVLFNSMMRGYYGFFIHANLPWTYGVLGKYIVSPAMHRWHHSAEEKAFDKNFSEFFCIFDRMFGTYYLPGPCDGPLGVSDDMQPTLRSQIGFAFSPRAYRKIFSRKPQPHEEPAL
ncbi:sterol desaturase family protein [Phaeobacter marinintestinus]|uniref:sterol desaturase family protein n=1 Tax=Falsiphaeobacter marinintestinus TaxID=1492905 RepID=UPI0011B6513B|nr:sterol desaturase family protein [Phaeobacter marinintestinus]